jgi:hypothetical protein
VKALLPRRSPNALLIPQMDIDGPAEAMDIRIAASRIASPIAVARMKLVARALTARKPRMHTQSPVGPKSGMKIGGEIRSATHARRLHWLEPSLETPRRP